MIAKCWLFPDNNGGQDDGLNDAGIETFNTRDDKFIAREAIQNIIDARRHGVGCVRAEFNVYQIAVDQIPDIEGLRDAMRFCLLDWESNPTTKSFFEKAGELVSKDSIRILKISDYGTRGVVGDEESKDSDWYNLVKSRGSSFKRGTSGGSYGIGKNAPFAASEIRTVLYSTLTEGGEYAFQGVSKLVTHTVGNYKTQGTGFYGLAEGNHAIRNFEEIPDVFKRSDVGTDIYVLSYSGSDDWKKNLKQAVLENFWPAIHSGLLEVKVGLDLIDKENLGAHIQQMQHPDRALPYYESEQHPDKEFTAVLDHLGEVKLSLKVSEGYLRRIEMVRNTGMVIYQKTHFRTRQQFAGVFRCNDEKGNELLRAMEPPSHDTWDFKRLRDDENYDIARRAYKELNQWLHKMVKLLEPEPTGDALDVDDVANYLPDEEDHTDDELNQDSGEQIASQETLERDDASLSVTVRSRPVFPRGDASEFGESSEDFEGENTGGMSEGGSRRNGSVVENTGDRYGSSGEDDGSSTSKDTVQRKVGYRTFLSNALDNTYRVVVTPDKSFRGSIKIKAVGEEGSPQPINISNARDLICASKLEFGPKGKIGGLEFTAGESRKFEVSILPMERLALTVVAYEDN